MTRGQPHIDLGNGDTQPDNVEEKAEGAWHPCQRRCIRPHLLPEYRGGPEALYALPVENAVYKVWAPTCAKPTFYPRRYVHGHLLRRLRRALCRLR